jgi:hypothetical protein
VAWPETESGKKERRQRTPADVAFGFPRGLSAQKPIRLKMGRAKQYPAGWKNSGGVYGLQGKSRIRILASVPRACLTRQAGFTAANSIRSMAKRSCAAVDSLEVSARLCLARRVGAEFRQDADCALADGNGDFRQCTVRKIVSVKRGFDPGEDRHAAAPPNGPPNPVSGMAQIPRPPVPRLTARSIRR